MCRITNHGRVAFHPRYHPTSTRISVQKLSAVKLGNRTRSVVEENLGENGHRYNAQSVGAMRRGPQKRERGNR